MKEELRLRLLLLAHMLWLRLVVKRLLVVLVFLLVLVLPGGGGRGTSEARCHNNVTSQPFPPHSQ